MLVACTVLLGTVAGVATGYAVQADRDPTPLPPLSQPELGYPAKPLPEGEEPEPISAKHDRRVRTDGDLRKLLLKKPKGARDTEGLYPEDGWMTLAAYARSFYGPRYMFQYLIAADIRRIAVGTWRESGGRGVNIRLIQFRDYKSHAATEHAREQLKSLTVDYLSGEPLEKSTHGRYFVYDEQLEEGGPTYSANAIARRGDITMQIWIGDSKPIGKKVIRELAERQLERL